VPSKGAGPGPLSGPPLPGPVLFNSALNTTTSPGPADILLVRLDPYPIAISNVALLQAWPPPQGAPAPPPTPDEPPSPEEIEELDTNKLDLDELDLDELDLDELELTEELEA